MFNQSKKNDNFIYYKTELPDSEFEKYNQYNFYYLSGLYKAQVASLKAEETKSMETEKKLLDLDEKLNKTLNAKTVKPEEEKKEEGGGFLDNIINFFKDGLLGSLASLFNPAAILKILGKVFVIATIFISLFKGITAAFDKWKETLINHIMVLLGGRIAEEIFFGESISIGASKDLEEAKNLAENMILTYGMGNKLIHSSSSDKSKAVIDNEIHDLIDIAYARAKILVVNSKKLIDECSQVLITEHVLTPEFIKKKIDSKYLHLKHL